MCRRNIKLKSSYINGSLNIDEFESWHQEKVYIQNNTLLDISKLYDNW